MMQWLIPVLAAGSVLLWLLPRRVAGVGDRVGGYLEGGTPDPPIAAAPSNDARLVRAGLSWTPTELRVRRVGAAVAGSIVGLLIARGDVFVTGTQRSAPGLALTGGFAGLLFISIWITRREERRRRALMEELPLLADVLTLQILAGESVIQAIEHLAANGEGVGVGELQRTLDRYRGGHSLTESLVRTAGETAQPEARRLYELLAAGHHTGGRLAADLSELSRDYRSKIERELVAESGTRAVTVYAPILALMIPVTLVFLVYPALAGLRSLAGQ